MRKVLIFGTFDGIHEGHRSLFRQAREHGEQLIVVVAQDHIVELLKNHPPQKTMDERIDGLLREDGIDAAVAGDLELGTYYILKRHRPHVIALGYDQHALKHDLEEHAKNFDWELDIIVLDPHKPDEYHNHLEKNKK